MDRIVVESYGRVRYPCVEVLRLSKPAREGPFLVQVALKETIKPNVIWSTYRIDC